jgi:putative spermidine/putrescine transport system substrate-binding protein
VVAANRQGRDFSMSWTNQLYAMDFWTMPKGGQTKGALDLIAYMSSAERQKVFAEKIVYGVTNTGAGKLIAPEVQSMLPTAPENLAGSVPLNTAFWVDHEEDLQQRFVRWVAQ